METDALRAAEVQHGVVGFDEVGLSARKVCYRVKRGRWHKVLPGVIRIGGAPDTWEAQLTAALKWAGPKAVISHAAAGKLHGWSPFENTTVVQLSAPRSVRAKGFEVHKRQALNHHDVTECQGFRVSAVPRTLLDLAEDASVLETCLDEALRKKQVTLEALQTFLDRSSGRRFVARLQALVAKRRGDGGPTESKLEQIGLEAIDAAGLPRPEKQVKVRLSRQRARVDFMYVRAKVVVELDGYATHSDIRAFEADRTRANGLVRRGFTLLRWTWNGVTDRPEELTDELKDVLRSRGGA